MRRLLPGRGARFALGLALACAVLGGGFVLIRDSALVRVTSVRVTGTHGPAAPGIDAALTRAGLRQTTLHVDLGRLRAAVASYPEVRGISASASFPHGLIVRVDENEAVGVATIGNRQVAVAADGTLMPSGVALGGLPLLSFPVTSARGRIAGGPGLAAVALLAAAPDVLRPRIAAVIPGRALQVELHDGPALIFGSGGRLLAKWDAALRVLADPGAAGATYVDLRLPERPAAGGGGVAGVSASAGTGVGGITAAAAASVGGAAGTTGGSGVDAGAPGGGSGGAAGGSGTASSGSGAGAATAGAGSGSGAVSSAAPAGSAAGTAGAGSGTGNGSTASGGGTGG